VAVEGLPVHLVVLEELLAVEGHRHVAGLDVDLERVPRLGVEAVEDHVLRDVVGLDVAPPERDGSGTRDEEAPPGLLPLAAEEDAHAVLLLLADHAEASAEAEPALERDLREPEQLAFGRGVADDRVLADRPFGSAGPEIRVDHGLAEPTRRGLRGLLRRGGGRRLARELLQGRRRRRVRRIEPEHGLERLPRDGGIGGRDLLPELETLANERLVEFRHLALASLKLRDRLLRAALERLPLGSVAEVLDLLDAGAERVDRLGLPAELLERLGEPEVRVRERRHLLERAAERGLRLLVVLRREGLPRLLEQKVGDIRVACLSSPRRERDRDGEP
jgi:hypothetical protein